MVNAKKKWKYLYYTIICIDSFSGVSDGFEWRQIAKSMKVLADARFSLLLKAIYIFVRIEEEKKYIFINQCESLAHARQPKYAAEFTISVSDGTILYKLLL